MHREYHPEDMRRQHARAFGGQAHDHDHPHGHDHDLPHDHAHHDDHRSLYALTGLLGLLIGADLLLGVLGLDAWRKPLFGVSWVWWAAVIGAARIVYGALAALVQGRIGADFVLAQACVAAVVLGE